jgi:hypothetical protein
MHCVLSPNSDGDGLPDRVGLMMRWLMKGELVRYAPPFVVEQWIQ